MGYQEVNLNLGCPSGTVVAKGKGSGFLAFPEELDRFLDEIFTKAPCAISIKTRIGLKDPAEFPALLAIYRKYPIKELIVHPRVQKDLYKNTPRLACFGDALEGSPFPVCYNGDLYTPDAVAALQARFPGTDRLMLGRGLAGDPARARGVKGGPPTAKEARGGDSAAKVGSTLLKAYGRDIKIRPKARAAAGSDARMSGCELPVVINSGSGNQGLTVSLPVIEYARELGSSQEELYRALTLSNLITLHAKEGIGRLSAYCGAVSAGAGAGAGIACLHGGDYDEIAHTIVNALAITSGIVCDGAKASCAAKIAAAVDAGILGFEMYRNGQQFYGGDGLVLKGVENTIRNISRLGRVGMRETDREIIRMMVGEDKHGDTE